MENQRKVIDLEIFVLEITQQIKKRMLAISEQEDNTIEIDFLNGLEFRVSITRIS